MIKIRKNVFETNSSSTHAFCIDSGADAVKFTHDHFEAFTEYVYPYTPAEVQDWPDPVILIDLKDKVRYFWTVFLQNLNHSNSDLATNFMRNIQATLPQAVFCYQFPTDSDSWIYSTIAYLEDCNYVLNDYFGEDITKWSKQEVEQFLAEGVVIFGDRDRCNEYGDSIIDELVGQVRYKKIISISG